MAFNGPDMISIYSKTDGMVRFSKYRRWTQNGYGFDLLP
jgi:hypothetical protein